MAKDLKPDIPYESLACTDRERALFGAMCAQLEGDLPRYLGRVVRLDRGYPLVCCEKGSYRAEHAVSLIKTTDTLACVGDWVVLTLPEDHERGIIEGIIPRKQAFVRKDPSERTGKQIIAANVDLIFLLQALSKDRINVRRLEREMVVAYDSGAIPIIVLTKADLAGDLEGDIAAVHKAVPHVDVIVESAFDGRGIEEIRSLITPEKTAVLVGASGVGKSALTNALVGGQYQKTGEVRAGDDRGRHTTVSRDMYAVVGGGVVIDTPGVRALALWDADAGIAQAFPEITERAPDCRFRDCTHTNEPGCAVIAAVDAGEIPMDRLMSYQNLQAEIAQLAARQVVRARMDRKRLDRTAGKTIKHHYNSSGRRKWR